MRTTMKLNFSLSKPQRGGTLLGLLLGALLGLGAALAVAVYVTKVPMPFLNKTQPKGADTDAAEAKKNKDWDPNAALAGKSAAKPQTSASGALGTASPTAAPAVVLAPGAAAAATGSVASVKPKVSADPLGDLAKAQSDTKNEAKADARPDPSSNSGADPFNYFVQAGAYRTPEDAEQQRAKLLLMGFQAKVTEREQSGRTVFRVRLGPFDKKDDADRNKEKLEGNGIETALVRVQR